jgi:predicted nucleic acid-binding protein
MKVVFADTLYWVAIVNPRDQWREQALAVSQSLGDMRMVTTQEVLIEFLNALASAGPHVRERAGALVEQMGSDPSVEILPQSQETFHAGFELHRSRPDKGYSLTDCISMAAMRARGITEVLTHDHHFGQEGFIVLLRR